MVHARVSNNNHTRLLERAGDVVRERTRGEAAGNGRGTGVRGELEHSTVTVCAARNHDNVGRVLNSSKNTGSQDKLLPGLADVDKVHTVGTALVHVRQHGLLTVLRADVSLGSQKQADVLRGRVQDGRMLRHGRFCVSCCAKRALRTSSKRIGV